VADPAPAINPSPRYEKRRVPVLDTRVALVDEGAGDPIVFVHGNPSSSYLWRNVIPHLREHGRCLAPDHIGMGDSDRLANSGPDRYGYLETSRYFEALMDALGLRERVTLVLHDWGAAVGLRWASRHASAVRAIAHTEAFCRPLIWSEFPEWAKPVFTRLRSPEGEKMVIEENFFIERILREGLAPLRGWDEATFEHYRRPFREPGEGRRALLQWPRSLPIDDEPADVARAFEDFGRWFASSPVPKLWIRVEPGQIPPSRRAFLSSLTHQETAEVAGAHFPQEDSPDEIGRAIADWYTRLP